jgi:alkylation response protein AidB-like acyl-CoA dehydrogenase
MGPTAFDLLEEVRNKGGCDDPLVRQRLAALHTEATLLDLIRFRTISARIRGEQPGPEASIRKILADEHGQRTMALAKDLRGAEGMVAAVDTWDFGYLFSMALTIGGGTGEVQRNIVGERVLGLPAEPAVQ